MPSPSRTIEVNGYAIRVVRQARGKSVQNLADGIAKDRSYITHLENMTKWAVSPEVFAALCRELLIGENEDQRALMANPSRREVPRAVPA